MKIEISKSAAFEIVVKVQTALNSISFSCCLIRSIKFILLLPFEVPVAGLLVIGFLTGLSVDAFMNTPGIHAFATVLLAYLRTNVLNALLPKHLSDYKAQAPSVKNMNWTPFLTYAAFLIVIHHTAYFVIELWSMENVGYLILKIIASTITTPGTMGLSGK